MSTGWRYAGCGARCLAVSIPGKRERSPQGRIESYSLATIQPVLKAWRAERDAQMREQRDAAPEPGEASAVPMRVSQALDTAHAGLDQVAQAVVDAINAAIADERRRARLELEAEQKAVERARAAGARPQ